jgi:hypothetical protein
MYRKILDPANHHNENLYELRCAEGREGYQTYPKFGELGGTEKMKQ